MEEAPYIPFYKPYGMSDEEYEYEVRIAEIKYQEWLLQIEELNKPITTKF